MWSKSFTVLNNKHIKNEFDVTCISQISFFTANTAKLDSGKAFPEAGYFTPVSVYSREKWGRVCGRFWDDDDARVACRQLGYSGGLATYSTANWTLPHLISEINCVGTEANLLACPQSESLCYDERSASVVCNQVENKGKHKRNLMKWKKKRSITNFYQKDWFLWKVFYFTIYAPDLVR